MGPKPSITVQVENGPGNYYIALLHESGDKTQPESVLNPDTLDDSSVQDYLKGFYHDGWVYHMSPVGSNCYRSNPENIYRFGYMVPDIVKVILISSDGTVYISDSLDVKEFNAQITYDVTTGTLNEKPDTGKPLKRAGLMMTFLVLTLALELIILKLFKYPLSKRNTVSFIIINVLTNIPYTGFLLLGLFDRANLPVILLVPFMELIITIVESVFYVFALRDGSGKKTGLKNFLYGIVANVFSAVMGDAVIIGFWTMTP